MSESNLIQEIFHGGLVPITTKIETEREREAMWLREVSGR